MKKKQRSLDIPQPCGEHWESMTPMLDGRFCKGCKRVVVDFTKMSDREIIRYFKVHTGKVCGQVKADQMRRELKTEPVFLSSGLRNAATVALVSSVTITAAEAQTTPCPPLIEQVSVSDQQHVNVKNEERFREISGLVLAEESGEPLIGANVWLDDTKIGCITDFDGAFRLKVPECISGEVELNVVYASCKKTQVPILLPTELPGSIEPLQGIQLESPVILSPDYSILLGAVSYGITVEETDDTAEADPISIEELYVSPSMIVNPNPFVQSIRLKLRDFPQDRYDIYLFNDAGQEIWADRLKISGREQEMNVEINKTLIDGNYILHVRSKKIQLSEVLIRKE